MSRRKALTAAEILTAEDLPREFVPTPEWANGDAEAGVFVRTVTGFERDKFETWLFANKEDANKNVRAKICALCITDDEGTPLFDEHQVEALGGKSAKALDRIFAVAQRLNGFTDNDVRELAKNSSGDPSAASS